MCVTPRQIFTVCAHVNELPKQPCGHPLSPPCRPQAKLRIEYGWCGLCSAHFEPHDVRDEGIIMRFWAFKNRMGHLSAVDPATVPASVITPTAATSPAAGPARGRVSAEVIALKRTLRPWLTTPAARAAVRNIPSLEELIRGTLAWARHELLAAQDGGIRPPAPRRQPSQDNAYSLSGRLPFREPSPGPSSPTPSLRRSTANLSPCSSPAFDELFLNLPQDLPQGESDVPEPLSRFVWITDDIGHDGRGLPMITVHRVPSGALWMRRTQGRRTDTVTTEQPAGPPYPLDTDAAFLLADDRSNDRETISDFLDLFKNVLPPTTVAYGRTARSGEGREGGAGAAPSESSPLPGSLAGAAAAAATRRRRKSKTEDSALAEAMSTLSTSPSFPSTPLLEPAANLAPPQVTPPDQQQEWQATPVCFCKEIGIGKGNCYCGSGWGGGWI